MGKVIEINNALWAKLSVAARRERGTPAGVVGRLIREFLEAERDLALDAAIGKDVRRSGYKEADAVRVVREYREQMPSRRAGRIREPSRRYRPTGRG